MSYSGVSFTPISTSSSTSRTARAKAFVAKQGGAKNLFSFYAKWALLLAVLIFGAIIGFRAYYGVATHNDWSLAFAVLAVIAAVAAFATIIAAATAMYSGNNAILNFLKFDSGANQTVSPSANVYSADYDVY